MEDLLLKTVQIIQKKKIRYIDELSITSLILGILYSIGWDVFDPYEVEPQSKVYSGKVDLALRVFGYRIAFIEIKRSKESLKKHEPQIIGYLNDAAEVEVGVLTNAVEWWFYKRSNYGTVSTDVTKLNLKNDDLNQLKIALESNLSKDKFREKTFPIFSKSKLHMFEIEDIKSQLSEEDTEMLIKSNINIFNSSKDVYERLRILGCLRGFKDNKLIATFEDIFKDLENEEDIRLSALFGLSDILEEEKFKQLLLNALNDNNPNIRDKVEELLVEYN